MLVIRDPQMDAFSEAAIERFEDALTAHFKEQLPVHYEALGDAGTRNAIRYGIDRARSYGIQTELGITIYIRHMFLFGQDYDRDPQLPWAAKVLNEKSIRDEQQRLERLSEASMIYLRALISPIETE